MLCESGNLDFHLNIFRAGLPLAFMSLFYVPILLVVKLNEEKQRKLGERSSVVSRARQRDLRKEGKKNAKNGALSYLCVI